MREKSFEDDFWGLSINVKVTFARKKSWLCCILSKNSFKVFVFCASFISRILRFQRNGLNISSLHTLRSQIEGYTRILIFRKFSSLPAVIWASPFIYIQENLQLFCFFTYTNENFSTLPAVIRASPLIKFRKEFQSTLLLEPPLVLETQE